MRAYEFTENKLGYLINKQLLLEKVLPDNHVAVAVLGAPASGKSYTVNLIKNLATKENSKKMATVMDPDNNKNTVLTVDKLRSELQNMSPEEQIYSFYQAYGYIRQLAAKDPENYDKWVIQIKKTWEKIDDESDEITTGVTPDGTLIFNNANTSEGVRKLINQINPNELKKILFRLDQYEDYKRVVRWFQNVKQTQATQNKNNIVYDEAGDEPSKIIERMKDLRNSQDPYITLIFLIHGKSPVTNLIQNAFRMVSGSDDGRDSSGAIIQAWNDIQSGIGKYYDAAENVITVGSEKEIVQSFKTMTRLNTDDNADNPNKYIDLLALVRTQTPEQAYDLFSSKLSNDPLAVEFFNAILLFNSKYTDGLNSESKQILSKLIGNRIKDLYSSFTKVVKSGKFNHKLNNLQRMYAKVQQDAGPKAPEKINTINENAGKKIKVFCDVDGVLADFDEGTKKYTSTFSNNWSDLPDDFFARLNKLPGSTELVNFLSNEFGENFYILTAIPKPKRGKISLRAKQDKIDWLIKNFRISSNKILVVYREEKRDFADVNNILIDDTPLNIQEWEDAGGVGILFKNNSQTLTALKKKIANIEITEAPLQDYVPIGDFEKSGPFRGPDKKLVPHPTNILKTQKFLEKTPYDFRLFFSNIPGTGKYSEHGPADDGTLRKMFGNDVAQQIIDGSSDAITVVFVGNKGDAKVPLTPWMMAHRFGHAIQAGVRQNRSWSQWGEVEKHFFSQVNSMLEEYYGKPTPREFGSSSSVKYDLTPEYNALFNAIGTQRSSRQNQIKRPYEFLYELFAQYLGTGKVTLNPLPASLGYGRKNWGNPSRYLNMKPEYRNNQDAKEATDILGGDLEYMFDDLLNSYVGTIFVM